MVYFKVARAFCFITAFDSSTVRCVFAFVFLQVVFLLDVDVDDVAKVVQKLFARLLFVFSFEFLQIDG